MRHTETNTYDVKRLLHVKGKKRVFATEVGRTVQSLCNITGSNVQREFMFSFVSGGDELGKLQPWRCVFAGHRKDHRSVEWTKE